MMTMLQSNIRFSLDDDDADDDDDDNDDDDDDVTDRESPADAEPGADRLLPLPGNHRHRIHSSCQRGQCVVSFISVFLSVGLQATRKRFDIRRRKPLHFFPLPSCCNGIEQHVVQSTRMHVSLDPLPALMTSVATRSQVPISDVM